MELRWVVQESDEQKISSLRESLNVNPTICRLLTQRGINTYEEAKRFFRPSLDDLHDPFLMKDMDVAIARITEAIDKKEKILIYGDYDVDGTTAVSLFYTYFSQFTDNLEYYIPDRYKEGYGLSMTGVDWAKERGVEVIVSLDCGITAIDEIQYAQSLGIEVIVGDHHLPGDDVPPAFAVLDPKQSDCCYPYGELSGAGIGFKICQGYAQFHKLEMDSVFELLDLVAISIASDIVPVTGENRVLAYFGLQKINGDPRPGVKAIFDSLRLDREISLTDLVFIVGPRINAAGRMEHAKMAVALLIHDNSPALDDKINEINTKNEMRKDIDRSITEEALSMIDNDEIAKAKYSTVLYKADWHKGVIGIVASRLIESYYKPTIVLSMSSDGLISGSARSVKGFSVYNAICECSDLLESFGGHKYAAGLSMTEENLPLFIERFEQVVKASITEDSRSPQLTIDAEINLPEITSKFYNILKQFEPFGPGNMKPVFVAKNIHHSGQARLLKEKHLKLRIYNGGNQSIEGIGFGLADKHSMVNAGPVDLCFTVDENHWNNKTTLQMRLKDVKPSR